MKERVSERVVASSWLAGDAPSAQLTITPLWTSLTNGFLGCNVIVTHICAQQAGRHSLPAPF